MREPRRFSFADAGASALVRARDRAVLRALRVSGVRTRRVLTRAGRVHMLVAQGQGALPPVVLLHGLSSGAVDFAPVMRRLTQSCRQVIVPDLPGHGESDPPPMRLNAREVLDCVCEALDQVLDQPATIFGNSLGGAAALRFAISGSPFAGSLFLVSPAGGHGDADEADDMRQLLRAETYACAREFMRRVLPTRPWTRDLLAWGARVRLRRAAVRDLIDRTSPHDLLHPGELSELSLPIALVWGGREHLLPSSHRRFFRETLPSHTRFMSPPTFGHAPCIDHAQQVASMVQAFAADVATARTLRAPSMPSLSHGG